MHTALTLFGGLGLFLLGLHLMIDGLKAAAGDALARYLAKFTGGTMSAVLSGAGVTALIQSSSATTVATIGFVSAGLLTFPQALGVIIGANIGTTSTGWLVSLLGLRVSISAFALPLVGLGAVLHIAGRGHWRPAGLAMAGFGVVFIGIQVLQDGMAGAADFVDMARFGADGLLERLLLVGVGLAMTVIMQSSSAAVATTLVAVAAGTIDIHQGAALVVGQNVGTTITAVIAAIGGSTAAKRTSLAHVLFNGGTGIAAYLALPLFVAAVMWFSVLVGMRDPTLHLAMFHTAFKLVGAALILPFTQPFARAIEWIVPERGNPLTRYLDTSVLATPGLAFNTIVRTVFEVAAHGFRIAAAALSSLDRPGVPEQAEVHTALEEIQQFIARLTHVAERDWEHDRFVHLVLALEHLTRVNELMSRMPPPHRLQPYAEFMRDACRTVDAAADWAALEAAEPLPESLMESLGQLEREYRRLRHDLVRAEQPATRTVADLVALRWLDHLLHHLRRGLPHLNRIAHPGEEEPATQDEELGEV